MATTSARAYCATWSRSAWVVISQTAMPITATDSAKTPANIADRRKPSVRITLVSAEDIADAAQGMDQFGIEAAIHLGAQPAEMGLHDVGAGIEMQVPDIFQQHGARHHAACIADQKNQLAEFLRLQNERQAGAQHRAAEQVHLQV